MLCVAGVFLRYVRAIENFFRPYQFLDRTNPLFPSEYKFRDIYFLLTAADTEQTATEGPLKGLQGWIDCFEKAKLKGVVCGLGAEKPGDVKAMPAMAEAYELGRNV